MTRIAELRTRQEAHIARSNEVLAEADRAGRELTADERHAIGRRTAAVEALQLEIDELEIVGDYAAAPAAQPQARQTAANAGEPLGSNLGRSTPSAQRTAPMVNLAEPVQRPSAAALFGRSAPRVAAAGQDESFSRWLNALAMRDTSYLMSRPNAAGTDSLTGASGGFGVPAAHSTALLDSIVEQSQFMSLCRVVPMLADEQDFPVLNMRDRTKGPGKFTAQKLAEGAAGTIQTADFSEVALKANKRMTLWTVTAEVLQGGPGVDQALIRGAAGTMAMQLDREIWAGTGAAEMLGVNNAAALVVASKDGGQSANTVSFSNLTAVIARLLPSAFNGSAWFVNPATLPQLFTVYHPVMDSTNVVGGLPAPLTQGPDGSYRLFGRPLVITDFAPALSSQGDISLIDLSWYLIGLREELRFEVSRDFAFDEDKVTFKVVQRRAGQPILSGPVTPAVGSATLSPFVQLEAR